MAEESINLMAYFSGTPAIKADGPFEPVAYFGAEEDALLFYFRNEPDYAKRLNSRVTAYLAMSDDSLVGCQIKGVQSAIDDLGAFDISLSDGKTKLRMLFMAFWGTVADDPEARSVFREVVKAAAQADLTVELGT